MAYHSEDFVRAVESIYPGQIKNRVDFICENDGSGPVIGAWYRNDLAQPTQAQIEAVDTDALPLPPVPLDANARLDAGIAAALDVATVVRDALQATPNNFTATNFAAAMIQLDALTQAFVAMLQAQAAPPP